MIDMANEIFKRLSMTLLGMLPLLEEKDNVLADIQRSNMKSFSYGTFCKFKKELFEMGFAKEQKKVGRKKPFDLTKKGVELRLIALELRKWCLKYGKK